VCGTGQRLNASKNAHAPAHTRNSEAAHARGAPFQRRSALPSPIMPSSGAVPPGPAARRPGSSNPPPRTWPACPCPPRSTGPLHARAAARRAHAQARPLHLRPLPRLPRRPDPRPGRPRGAPRGAHRVGGDEHSMVAGGATHNAPGLAGLAQEPAAGGAAPGVCSCRPRHASAPPPPPHAPAWLGADVLGPPPPHTCSRAAPSLR
jgi:hypothetical protein